jgi:hypothetical protein
MKNKIETFKNINKNMKTLHNFITEEYNQNAAFKNAGSNLEDYSPVIYHACLHADSIIEMVKEYKDEFGDEDYINWGEYGPEYESLTSEATEALMAGELDCEPEYRLMIRCAEAEWENKGGYWKQLEKELKPINEMLMKES